jgi:uncharacterized protein (TIGR03067 family)
MVTAGTLLLAIAKAATSEAIQAALVEQTVQAATSFSSVAALSGMVSERVCALVKGGLTAMWLSKAKIVTVLMLVIGLAGVTLGISLAQDRLALASPTDAEKEEKAALQKLQGKWALETIEHGETKAKMFNCEWNIKGNQLEMSWVLFAGLGNEGNRTQIVRLKPILKGADGKPAHPTAIDLIIETQAQEVGDEKSRKALKVIAGIYEFDGSHLKVATRHAWGQNTSRPTKFKIDDEDGGLLILTFDRAK